MQFKRSYKASLLFIELAGGNNKILAYNYLYQLLINKHDIALRYQKESTHFNCGIPIIPSMEE